jgi:2-haloacid dehalogenase
MDERTVAWDVIGTVVEIAPVTERYGEAAMPRLLHLALALQSLGEFVPFPRLVAAELGEEALEVFASLDPSPDAEPAMRTLQEAGIRQVALTNGSVENTETLLERGGLRHFVDRIHSVEEARAYKPAPEPYALVDAASTVLIAVHDWDVAGARAAGLRAVWVDRDEEGWKLPLPEPERVVSLVAAAEAAAT